MSSFSINNPVSLNLADSSPYQCLRTKSPLRFEVGAFSSCAKASRIPCRNPCGLAAKPGQTGCGHLLSPSSMLATLVTGHSPAQPPVRPQHLCHRSLDLCRRRMVRDYRRGRSGHRSLAGVHADAVADPARIGLSRCARCGEHADHRPLRLPLFCELADLFLAESQRATAKSSRCSDSGNRHTQ